MRVHIKIKKMEVDFDDEPIKGDTEIINEMMARKRAEDIAKRDAEANRPKKSVTDTIREMDERDAAAGIVRQVDVSTEKEVSFKKEPRLSQYRGVCYFKPTGQWTANIKHEGRRYTKYLESEMGAAKEYDRMAVKFRGESAVTNFPKLEKDLDAHEEIKFVPREYLDRDVVISSARIRMAMQVWVASRPFKYTNKRQNWIIFTDLFYPDGVPDNIEDICKSMDIIYGDKFL